MIDKNYYYKNNNKLMNNLFIDKIVIINLLNNIYLIKYD